MLRYSKRTLKKMLDVKSDEKIRQLVKTKALPAPIKDSPKGPCFWLHTDVQAYLDSLVAKRDPAPQ